MEKHPHVTHHVVTLDLHADVADWNPNAGYEHLLAAGTYELNEEQQTRHGKLYTYTVGMSSNGDESLRVEKTLDNLPGIFDFQWVPGSMLESQTMVAMALADGSLRFFDAISGEEQDSLSTLHCNAYYDASAMALTVDTLRQGSGELMCTSSYSDGDIKVFKVAPHGIQGVRQWNAHSLEAWISCWSRVDDKKENIIYSGGDDAVFQAWDIRAEDPSRVFMDRKTHQAGVCCVTETPSDPNIVLTGSYDQNIRIWDWRNTNRPVCTTQCDTGGGVWRLKSNPHNPRVLLAACMYNGFFIYKIMPGDGNNALKLVECEQYPHQQTLSYGAAWQFPRPDSQHLTRKDVVATCSFYDNLLHIWTPGTPC